jgi:hypothetical protein
MNQDVDVPAESRGLAAEKSLERIIIRVPLPLLNPRFRQRFFRGKRAQNAWRDHP